jgi:hypothetical protein
MDLAQMAPCPADGYGVCVWPLTCPCKAHPTGEVVKLVSLLSSSFPLGELVVSAV